MTMMTTEEFRFGDLVVPKDKGWRAQIVVGASTDGVHLFLVDRLDNGMIQGNTVKMVLTEFWKLKSPR